MVGKEAVVVRWNLPGLGLIGLIGFRVEGLGFIGL